MRSQWRLVLWCYPTPLHVHPGHLRDLSRLLRKAFVKTGFFSDNSPEAIAHDEVYNKGNPADNLVAGAIAYEATRLYNQYMEKGGEVNNYGQAQDLLTGFATDALTHIVQTYGRAVHDEWHLAAANKLIREVTTERNYR